MIEKKQFLSLKSTKENIHQVEKFVEDICDEFNINNTYFGNILVALTEALSNAIVHGNKNDVNKDINITFESKPIGLSFTIQDEGNGFDFNNIPDPTDLAVELKNEEGRGIFLMKVLADEVNFLDNGKSIELIFKISSINQELALDRIKQLQIFATEKNKKVEKL
ncbi:MAG: ATP-binding protein [Bacteroidetes bacterium]|jgi:serine/threonine-protein kinase RsbW|nr:ATP-binding protein [Bacteroidota bacterium]